MSPERKAHMWGWALKLARSGDHIGSGSIEKELEVLGFSAPLRRTPARQALLKADQIRRAQGRRISCNLAPNATPIATQEHEGGKSSSGIKGFGG